MEEKKKFSMRTRIAGSYAVRYSLRNSWFRAFRANATFYFWDVYKWRCLKQAICHFLLGRHLYPLIHFDFQPKMIEIRLQLMLFQLYRLPRYWQEHITLRSQMWWKWLKQYRSKTEPKFTFVLVHNRCNKLNVRSTLGDDRIMQSFWHVYNISS